MVRASNQKELHRPRHWPGGGMSHAAGFTAIEVSIALLIVSFLSIFALQVVLHLQSLQLETQRVDSAIQIARNVLNDLKAEPDWRTVEKRTTPVRRYDTDFTVQLVPRESTGKGLADLELTISWIGKQGLEQMVFNTTVPDPETGS